MNEKVLVAMSGGVDSAAAACILKDAGYDVSGITMRLWSEEERLTDTSCGADRNIADAKAVADALSIPHHALTLGDTFRREVIDSFLQEYKNGRTPNPCIECNKKIKFGALYGAAMSMGFQRLATGHYAKIKSVGDSHFICRAADERKDQSYFLWQLSEGILPHILLPLGDYKKDEIRELAADRGFSSAHRSDSQDICFIPDGDYVSFIHRESDIRGVEGDYIDLSGNVIGRHQGIISYTVGQRKGLGMAFGQPMFVGAKDAESNTVTLCTDAELYRCELEAERINLFGGESFETPRSVTAKIRYRHSPAPATVIRTGEDSFKVIFDQPQRAVTPGQSVVLYDGDTLIGGGIIK